MYVIHGTWIPAEKDDFVQCGAFYLWVETDVVQKVPRSDVGTVHPRHLMQTDLATFLREKLGVLESATGTLANTLQTKYMLLPTIEGRPTPSFELLRYVDEEEPLEFGLAPWQICCYRVPNVITTLKDIHFLALRAAEHSQPGADEHFQLGTDFLFWYQYTQALKSLLARDQYIPALKYQALPSVPTKGKSAKDESCALYATWEWLSQTYETTIERYVAAMPGVCTAGLNSPAETVLFEKLNGSNGAVSFEKEKENGKARQARGRTRHAVTESKLNGPDGAVLFEKETLLRHFSECLLNDIVTETPFTVKFEQQIMDTLLYGCVYPERTSHLKVSNELLEDYKRWQVWRANLTKAHTEAGFTLCFRLQEASSMAIDNWQLHFLVAARHDPSLKLGLEDYWHLKPRARAEACRPFGQNFEKNLLLALGYAARIYPTIWEGLATDQPTGCQLTLDKAFAFLKESAWVLNDAGYNVIVPSWWTPEGRQRTKVRLKTSVRRKSKGSAPPKRGYFSVDALIAYQYQLSIGGQPVTEEEWQQLVNAKTPLIQFRGEWMELDRDKMQQLLEFWQKHQHEESEVTLMDMLKIGAESGEDLEWEHDQTLQDMLSQLHDKSAFAPIEDPQNLRGTLRDYQRRGVAWLQYLESLGLNPCLADDMGLGKTMQIIAHLLKEREEREELGDILPTLIIAPTSVIGNWHKEIERFAPQLRTLVHQGGTRLKDKQAFVEKCLAHDVVLTSFTLARLDEKLLHSLEWQRVVVDEAQNIKNPQAAQTRAILKLSAPHRLAMTGTPVENRLRDLWSIFNFLNPGYLGKEAQFRKSFELPIYKENDQETSETLKKLVEPFILRRVKTDKKIINDLPDKIEQKMYCTLTPEQASLYEAVVRDVEEQIYETEGIQRKGLILSTLLKLKQICNHPMQFLHDGSAFTADRSHKLQRIGEMIEEMIESGESALIFTQFTEIGGALDRYLEQVKHYNTYYLYGGTSVTKRDRMVTEFQDPETEPSVFILSLKAGGVGLNLTKANHVFHFDRWWNPAVEDQATDRAFRIGQHRNVFVHKFITMGTLEERIDAMIEDKKRLSSLVVGADESWLTELDNDTFKDLIALRRSAVLE